MDFHVNPAQLAKSPLFSGMSDSDLEDIAAKSIKVYVREGMHLIKQSEDEKGFDFFVVLGGTAKVEVGGEQIAELGPGDVFGEMSLLSGRGRNADVTATSEMTLATMMIWDFRALTERHPHLESRIRQLAEDRART